MKLGKRIPFYFSDAGEDTRLGSGRFLKGLGGTVTGTLDFFVSAIVNSLGIVLTLLTFFTGFFMRAPMMLLFTGLFAIVGFVIFQHSNVQMGVDKTNLTKNQIDVDWPSVRQDLGHYFDVAANKIINFDYSKVPYPDVTIRKLGSVEKETDDDPGFSWFRSDSDPSKPKTLEATVRSMNWVPANAQKPQTNEATRGSWFRRSNPEPTYQNPQYRQSQSAERMTPPVYQERLYNDSATVQKASSHYPSQGGNTTFPVQKNAYRTARANNLYFRPGSNVEHTLRNCRYINKGNNIRYSFDIDGYVAGCRLLR